jgi:hypothetical protein
MNHPHLSSQYLFLLLLACTWEIKSDLDLVVTASQFLSLTFLSYEYLFKQFHQSITPNPQDLKIHGMWKRAWTSVKEYLLTCSPREELLYIGEWDHGVPASVMEKISKEGRDRGVKARSEELKKCENKAGLSVCVFCFNKVAKDGSSGLFYAWNDLAFNNGR